MSKPVWGVPWHGRVQGGLMYLPNGTTRPWRQPVGPTASRRYEHGFTFGQKLAGVPEVERTPEELAADLAAGHQWRNEFIVTGTDDLTTSPLEMSIANMRVGGWIYQDPNGKRWRLRMGGRYSFFQGGNLTISYSLRKFGAFGESNETFTPPNIVMSSAAMGQLTPALSGSTRYARVVDISKTGDRAILSIINSTDQSTPFAIGWLMISFSGVPGIDFTATPTALYTRAQTVGEIENDQPIEVSLGFFGHLYEPETQDDQTGAAPNCGHIDYINEPYTPAQDVPDPPGVNLVRQQYASGTNTLRVTGRVFAVWFDENGDPVPLLFDSLQQYTVNKVWGPASISGRFVWRESRSGPFCGTQTLSLQEEMTSSIDVAFQQTWVKSIRMYRAGHEKTVEMSRVHNYRKQATGTGTGKTNSGWTTWRVVSGNITDEQVVKLNGETVETKDDGGPVANFSYSTVDPDVEVFPLDSFNLMPSGFNFITGSGKYAKGNFGTGFWHWSNNIVGLRGFYPYGPNTLAPETTAGFTPAGILTPAPGALNNFFFGSWNPVTGEAFWPSETPVSWA